MPASLAFLFKEKWATRQFILALDDCMVYQVQWKPDGSSSTVYSAATLARALYPGLHASLAAPPAGVQTRRVAQCLLYQQQIDFVRREVESPGEHLSPGL